MDLPSETLATGSGTPDASETAGDGAAARPAKVRLCRVEDVPPGQALKVETDGLTVAVFNLDGEFCVTDDHCTHGPGSLSEGFIDGDCVECNFHQGVFNVRTGAVVQPPCIVPVRTYRVTVEAGAVYIDSSTDAPDAVKS